MWGIWYNICKTMKMGNIVKAKTFWMTKTAVLLALLIVLQWITKPLGQLVTGSCVNAVLAMAALLMGMGSGLTVALLSPIFAFLLGIAPNLVTVPAIMAGNAIFVALLHWIGGNRLWKQVLAVLAAAAAKFAVLYGAVTWLICGVAADALLAQGLLKKPMLSMLPATFSWPQLVTALIGGALAMLCVPVLKKALRNN